MPWVRFHAIKDYYDMPFLIGEHDQMKAVFNLSPCLLDQIVEYAQGIAREEKPVLVDDRNQGLDADADGGSHEPVCYQRDGEDCCVGRVHGH